MANARAPRPRRPLGKAGKEAWDRVWRHRLTWVHRDVDDEFVLLLCEAFDERAILRPSVLRGDNWRDRVALRQLDSQITLMMGELGLSPAQRKEFNAEVEQTGRLGELRALRGA